MKPGTRRWVLAMGVLVGLQLLAWAWGHAAEVAPPWHFSFARPAKSLVSTGVLLLFLAGNLVGVARLSPDHRSFSRWSVVPYAIALAYLPLFALAVLGAHGLVDGVNALVARAPDEHRTGVVAGSLHAADGTELTVVRFGEKETIELPLPRSLTPSLPPETAVAVESHHGVLFTWGRVTRLDPAANPAAPPPVP